LRSRPVAKTTGVCDVPGSHLYDGAGPLRL
jgi:hypothetical protein